MDDLSEGNVGVENFALLNGTLTDSGTLTVTNVMNWTGGTLTGSGVTVIPVGGVLNLSGDNSKYLGGHTINNAGTVRWTGGGNLEAYGAAVWTNQASGVFEIHNDAMIHTGGRGGGLRLDNAGIVRKSGATNTTTLSAVQLNNGSTLDLQSGSLSMDRPYVQTAGATLLHGGNLTVPQGIQIQSGTLGGAGTITGDVLSNGQVKPGDPLGTLWIVGNYTQGANGTLNVQLGGPNPGAQYDQLQVSGSASLDGGLDVRLTNGFMPGFNSRFEALTFGSRVGTFAAFRSDPLTGGNFLNPQYRQTGIDLVTVDARPEFTATGLSFFDGQLHVQLTGIAGQTYAIEATATIAEPLSWVPLATNVIAGSTLWDFVDPTSTNYPHRFYRARFAP